MMNIFATYEAAWGQSINYDKSGIFFSKNIDSLVKEKVSVLGVSNPLDKGRYLGMSLLVGKIRRLVFNFLKDIIWKKKSNLGMGSQFLREAMRFWLKRWLKRFLFYYMNVFLLPVSITDKIQR